MLKSTLFMPGWLAVTVTPLTEAVALCLTVEARLYAEFYGKALCHVNVGEDGNVDIVEFRG